MRTSAALRAQPHARAQPAHAPALDDRLRRIRPALLVLLFLLLARIPFLLIHPLQEDAYITLRTARHLAEAGELSFNLHEHFPGTTSLLYPLLIAFLDLLLHGLMIPGLQLVETLAVVAAAYLGSRALAPSGAQQRMVWLLSGCWPIALLMSYIGMETALLLLALSGCIYALAREGHTTLFAACLLLLPLLRPDAVAYALLFLAGMYLVDRAVAWRGAGALTAGILLLLAGTRLTTGSFLSATAHAKQIAYHPDHSAAAILGRVRDLFLGQSFLLPVATTYLARFSPLLFVLVTAAFAWCIVRARTRRERVLACTLAAATLVVPVAYAVGGVIFAWYLYPANWIAATVFIAVAVRLLSTSRYRLAAGLAAALLWTALAGIQWSKALTSGTEDYHFRGDIGRYLAQISHGHGTVFLEPAGLIPYYSSLRTVDEVGLVSPRITGFMQRDPVAWWFDYIRTDQPEYIVERQSFEHYETFQHYTLTPPQQQWFDAHYVLIRRAHYVPAAYHPSPLLRRIFALSRMEDYLVYQRRAP